MDLKKRQKYHAKKQKGLSPFSYIQPNIGKESTDRFNEISGNTQAVSEEIERHKYRIEYYDTYFNNIEPIYVDIEAVDMEDAANKFFELYNSNNKYEILSIEEYIDNNPLLKCLGEDMDNNYIDDDFDWDQFDYSDDIDDAEADIEHANIYGGDTSYCRKCYTKLKYGEDGYTYCPECNPEYGESAALEEDYWIDDKKVMDDVKKLSDDLESQGFKYYSDKYTGSNYYKIFAKKDLNDVAWKAIKYNHGKDTVIIDITYNQAIGNDPLDNFDMLRKRLGRALLGEDFEQEDSEEKCCICGANIIGYGNNAEPVKQGRCCDICNIYEVIPARLRNLRKRDLNESYEDMLEPCLNEVLEYFNSKDIKVPDNWGSRTWEELLEEVKYFPNERFELADVIISSELLDMSSDEDIRLRNNLIKAMIEWSKYHYPDIDTDDLESSLTEASKKLSDRLRDRLNKTESRESPLDKVNLQEAHDDTLDQTPIKGDKYFFHYVDSILEGEFVKETGAFYIFNIGDSVIHLPKWANISKNKEDIEGLESLVDKMEKDTKTPDVIHVPNRFLK